MVLAHALPRGILQPRSLDTLVLGELRLQAHRVYHHRQRPQATKVSILRSDRRPVPLRNNADSLTTLITTTVAQTVSACRHSRVNA